MINVTDFGTIGTGGDDAPVFQAAFDAAKAANGIGLRVPAGDFRFDSTVNYITTTQNYPSLILEGEGSLRTWIHNNHSGPAFNISTSASGVFGRSGHIRGISFDGLGTAVKMNKTHHFAFEDFHVWGIADHGIWLPTLEGDPDACSQVVLDQCRIESCGKWGIFGQIASGKNELSMLSIRSTSIISCGTTATTVGGGMFWHGQCVSFDDVAFVLNRNRGLYIEGGAGTPSEVYGRNLVFENNLEKHVQCYGISGMVFDNLQMYSNDTYKAKYGIWVNSDSAPARNILIRTAKVRASAGNNPYIAFCGGGANGLQNVRAIDVAWDNFGYAGQTQRVGFTA